VTLRLLLLMLLVRDGCACTKHGHASSHTDARTYARTHARALAHARTTHPRMRADLQMVNMSLRILSKPDEDKLPQIWKVRRWEAGEGRAAAAHGGCCQPRKHPACLHARMHACMHARKGLPGAQQPERAAANSIPLPPLTQGLGVDWEDRVLPSIGNEIVKATVAQFNAEQLLTQREKVSLTVSGHARTRNTGSHAGKHATARVCST